MTVSRFSRGGVAYRLLIAVLALSMALIPVLGQYEKAYAADIILNGVAGNATVAIGAAVTVSSSPTGNSYEYSWDGVTWSACVQFGTFDPRYFDVIAPETPGIHTLYVRTYTGGGSGYSCGNTPQGPDTRQITTVDVPYAGPPTYEDNPDLVPECGIDIILLLDESGSITGAGLPGAQDIRAEVRNSAIDFVTGLADTETWIRVFELDTGAREARVGGLTGFQEITSGAFLTAFANYMNATAGGSAEIDNYSPDTSSYTNWEGGLQAVLATTPRPGRNPLVIMFTDGDPTTQIVPPSPNWTNIRRVGQSLVEAIDEANEIKDAANGAGDAFTSHMFVVGYPNPALTTGNARSVSGPDSWPDQPNLGLADYIIKTPDVDLGDIFRAFATQLCGVTVTMNKYVDDTNSASLTITDPDDPGFDPNWLAGQGWQMEGTASTDTATQDDYTWEFPDNAVTAGDPAQAATTAAGRVNFAWKYVPPGLEADSSFIGEELPNATQDEEYYLRTINCPVTPVTPIYDVPLKQVFLLDLPKSSVSECNYFNTRMPELDILCVPGADNVNSNTAQVTAIVENRDGSAQAMNPSGTAVFSVTIPSGQLQNDLYVFSDPLDYTPVTDVPGTTVLCVRLNDRQVDCLLVDDATMVIGQPLPAGSQFGATIQIDQVLPADPSAQVQATVNGSQNTPTRFVTDSDTRICAQTTPITLARFSSGTHGGDTRFEWTTSSEVANAGFNLYSGGDPKNLTQIGDFLVSSVVDAMGPTDYTISVPNGNIPDQTVYLEEVGMAGVSWLHGPYQIGQDYGERVEPAPIDWAAINAQSDALAGQRAAADAGIVAAAAAELAEVSADEAQSGAFMDQYGAILDDPAQDGNGVMLPYLASAQPEDGPQADADYGGTPLADFRVDQTGICRVTHEDLLAAGVDLTGLRSRNLALFNKGEPVKFFVHSPQFFGPGAYIEFFCEAVDSRYTNHNFYHLALWGREAQRITYDARQPIAGSVAPDSYMENIHLEENTDFMRTPPYGIEGWFWDRLYWPGIPTLPNWTSKDFTIDLLAQGGGAPAVSAEVWGSADRNCSPDHFFDVEVNGQLALSDAFEGLTVHNVNIPNANVQQGDNSVTLRLNQSCSRYDFLYLDDVDVSFPRPFTAYDGTHLEFEAAGQRMIVRGFNTDQVTVYRMDGEELVRVRRARQIMPDGNYRVVFRGTEDENTAQQFYVVTDDALITPEVAPAHIPGELIVEDDVDLLMISHPDFMDALAPLKAHRESQGLSVLLVSSADVYDVYGDGIFGPDAIRAYIADAVDQMDVEYVLLGGGDTVDYLDYKNLDSVSFIPSYYEFFPSDGVLLSSPADPLLVDIEDEDGDGVIEGNKVPNLALGRLPFRTPQEAVTLVQKIIAYDSKDYGQTAVFAADEFDDQRMLDFTHPSDQFIAALPAGWTYETAYTDDMGASAAHDTVVAAINRGVAWSNFAGHSDVSFWGRPNILTTADVAALTNYGKPTVVSQWGCFTSAYNEPDSNSMALEFLVGGDAGAAAVLGTTTRSNPTNMDLLDRKLAPYVTQPGMTLGQAVQQAKVEFNAQYPFVYDVLTGMTILGDPTMSIVQP